MRRDVLSGSVAVDATGVDFELVRFDLVHRAMERTTGTNILFLDARRSNSLADNLVRGMGTRSNEIERGLVVRSRGVLRD